ncbi:PREDICTED: CASP-like protein 4A1 [Tarenaya hassleriana]|uniref:CASP-like protein 4A1 n=1 Tax=Tarenaya hassleriana TaxID=28532 RepID=UPI00053C0E4C|nr:PREDICTED: CASP-like protein 4A1 [Tarenaya hassleriana]
MEEQKKQQQYKGQQRDLYSRSPPPSSPSPSMSPLHHDVSSRSSAPPLPPPSQSLPDSPTVSSIPDSHGSSPHTVFPTPPLAVATPSQVSSVATTKAETPFRVTSGIANGDAQEQKLGESRRRLRPDLSSLRESRKGALVRKALLGFRVSAFVFCLVSFSIMVADRDQGWARDSFYKYKEFRYCMAANVIGFIYSGFQICDLLYLLSTNIRRSRHNLRHFLDFALDQMIAYLLASASTSASVRVDDWISNWGADRFPSLARAASSLSFLSFASFALISLASGYALCTLRSI